MKTWLVNFRNEWLKVINNPQIIWLVLIGGWTIVGWAWLIGQSGATTARGQVTHDLTKRLFPFLLLIRSISVPIFSMIFFATLHTERQNQTYSWLYRLPIELLQWHAIKILTATALCIFVMAIGLGLAAGVLYWYSPDTIAETAPFFVTYWLIVRHLLLLPIVVWLTLYSLALFIRSPVVAILIVLVLQMLGSFTVDFPNPFASLRLTLAHASVSGSFIYQPDIIRTQYFIATIYCVSLLLIGWLLNRWRPNWIMRYFSN